MTISNHLHSDCTMRQGRYYLNLSSYMLWRERNFRVFQGKATAADSFSLSLSLQLVNSIRESLSSRRGAKPQPRIEPWGLAGTCLCVYFPRSLLSGCVGL